MKTRKASVSIETLTKMYFEEKLTADKIGSIIGLTGNGVRWRLRKAGYALRRAGVAGVPLEQIRKLYFEDGLNASQVAKQLGVTPYAILIRLRKVGLIPRPKPFYNATPIEELARLYFEEHLTPDEVATKTGYANGPSVQRRLRTAGYKLRWTRNSQFSHPRLHATENPTTHDIAWAAGIYEGEGSCVTGKRNRAPNVSVAQAERWLVDRLKTLFGGAITIYQRKRTLKRTNGEEATVTYYYWRISGMRARGFLMTIYKFLSPRRQERIRLAFAS